MTISDIEPKPKSKGGRKRIPIVTEDLKGLEGKLPPREIVLETVLYWMDLGGTQEEIAGSFYVSLATLKRRLFELTGMTFEQLKQKCCGGAKLRLRQNQCKMSANNAAMAIWLGKIWLGQREDAIIDNDGKINLVKLEKSYRVGRIISRLGSKLWRLNNLYRIVDRNGESIPFKLNEVQKEVCLCPHNRKLILKARQLGMSTFAVLDFLDDALFNENLACGIVSYSLEHAQHIFKRIIGHALDTFPHELKELCGILSRSAREITFNNGSFVRVDTSLRGGAYPNVLVSEFGKTCARSPLKAEEVITGTLQAVPAHGKITIESTGEGNEGYFADMCHQAVTRGNDNLALLEYHLFFYPWYREPSYVLESHINIPLDLQEYFAKLEAEQKITLSQHQKNWYGLQRMILGDKLRQEFPSNVSEAFLSSSDAYYFASSIEQAYQSSRCISSQIFDPLASVYVSADIGINDLTVLIFFQVVHGEIRIIDYYSDSGKGVDFYARFLLHDKKYLIKTIFLPHDAGHRDGIIVENTYEREFKKYFEGTATKFIVLKKTDKNLNISQAKLKFERCVFVLPKVKPLLEHLGKYRKKWSESVGKYLDEPYHDIHSNYADSFIYGMQAVSHIEATNSLGDSLEKHKKVVEKRHTLI